MKMATEINSIAIMIFLFFPCSKFDINQKGANNEAIR